METSKLLKEKEIIFDGEEYIIEKKEVNLKGYKRGIKVFIKKK